MFYANLSPTVGSEQGGARPVVIIQNDVGNEHSPTTIVAPLTSRLKKKLPTHVQVCRKDNLSQNPIVMLEQMRAIDKQRLERFVGRLCDETMKKIDEAIMISLALIPEKKGEDGLNELQVFNSNEFGEIRTVVENGEPMFCLADVCRALELTQPSKVKERLSEKGVNTIPTLTKGGAQKLLYINEANLYKTIFQSRKESAEHFTDWVTSEVLPTLRKAGHYEIKPMSPEEMMRVQLGMIDGHEERISKLENTMNIDYGQQRVLEKEVAKVVIELLGGRDAPAYRDISKKVFSECNHDIKDYFNVNSRNNIPRLRFDDAVEYIRNWQPCSNTRIAIRECNAQMSMGG